jgi:hypothetical protein
MKIRDIIPGVIIIGILILFFFPNPESNFILYIGTALFFVIIVIFLILKSKRR